MTYTPCTTKKMNLSLKSLVDFSIFRCMELFLETPGNISLRGLKATSEAHISLRIQLNFTISLFRLIADLSFDEP